MGGCSGEGVRGEGGGDGGGGGEWEGGVGRGGGGVRVDTYRATPSPYNPLPTETLPP